MITLYELMEWRAWLAVRATRHLLIDHRRTFIHGQALVQLADVRSQATDGYRSRENMLELTNNSTPWPGNSERGSAYHTSYLVLLGATFNSHWIEVDLANIRIDFLLPHGKLVPQVPSRTC